VRIDEPDDLATDDPDQHHADDVDALRRRHAEASAKLTLDSEAGQHCRDLGAAAMNDDRTDARGPQKHHVGRKSRP
jgi:hypothetical protein